VWSLALYDAILYGNYSMDLALSSFANLNAEGTDIAALCTVYHKRQVKATFHYAS